MKTEYQYIRFEQDDVFFDSLQWACRTRKGGVDLGEVAYYSTWRQFVFQPRPSTEYSAGCLRDIAHFLDQLKAAKAAKNTAPSGAEGE